MAPSFVYASVKWPDGQTMRERLEPPHVVAFPDADTRKLWLDYIDGSGVAAATLDEWDAMRLGGPEYVTVLSGFRSVDKRRRGNVVYAQFGSEPVLDALGFVGLTVDQAGLTVDQGLIDSLSEWDDELAA